MSVSVETILDAAGELSSEERLDLAARLLESHPAEGVTLSVDDSDLAEELDRRAGEVDGWKSWNDFRSDLDAE